MTLSEIFEDVSARHPDQIAVRYGTEQLSYAELNARANQLAWHLRKAGVGPEVRVGLCLERSLEMVVGMLGILKAGGAYVPLDPAYPAERLKFMVADTQTPVVLTTGTWRGQLPFEGVRMVCLDEQWPEIAQESVEVPPSLNTAENLAYVMYTSGSTGTPKGVEVVHRAIGRLVLNTDYIALNESDVVGQASNAAFDASTFEIWGALLNGARLVGIRKEVSLSPRQLAAELEAQEITTLFLTTALFNEVAREAPQAFRGLKHLLFGGEAADMRWVREVLKAGGPKRLLHVYGPTETTTFATWYEVTLGEDQVAMEPIMPIARTMLADCQSSTQRLQGSGMHLTLGEIFEDVCARHSDQIAVRYGTEELSYGELNAQANQLARYLRKCGVGPDVLVGLLVERSLELMIGVLGITKAGGAYVPLDPSYPAERLKFMLLDTKAPVVVAQERLAGHVEPGDARVVCLDRQWHEIGLESRENLEKNVTADNLAYVIYTSGSTGTPKGTMVEHRGLRAVSDAQISKFGVGPGSRVLQFSSLSFDAFVFETLMAFGSGATLVLARREDLLPGAGLIKLLKQERITVVTLPPSSLAVLPAVDLPDLQTITAAGEACPARLVEQWSRGREFFNLYGPTEATIWTTVARCKDWVRPPPIGRPIANTEVYLLDPVLNPVPVGVVGELYIGGDGLARGYWNRPELTSQRFVTHPFRKGERLYKTGDLCRYRADGNLEFVGRNDEQVKIRGFRVELGEIESALRMQPGVKECVVTLREDEPGNKRLVGYVIAGPEAELTATALRRQLAPTLPDHMVPSAFVFLEKLPLTPNGKVDRPALPAPPRARPDEGEYVPPRTPVEEMLAGIWSELLGVEPVGVRDNFFALGGHSLAATQAISRIRDAFQVEVPFLYFFEHSTIAELAGFIEPARSGKSADPVDSIQPVARGAALPLSFSQERVWFMLQLHPANKAYNAQATLRFRGPLNAEALERSLNEIVQRHEIFRTTFSAVEDHPIQVIHPPRPVPLTVVDLTGLPAQEREAAAQRLLKEEIQKPFDVTRLPLVRWTLWRLHPEEHLLAHVEHHFVHDGWSFNVFIGELKELYDAFASGRPSPFLSPPVQFADFAVWQRQWMQGAAGQAQLKYWKSKLAGCPPLLELPTDRPRPAAQRLRGAVLRRDLPLELCEALRAFSRREGASLFMTFFSGFAALLQRYANQDEFCVGSGLASRRLRQTEGILGMIVNTVALRTDLSGNPTVRELLGRVRQTTLEAYDHQDLPFDQVVEALQPNRSLSYSPIYQVLFSFHDSPLTDLKWGNVRVEVTEGLSNGSAKSDLNIILIPRSEQQLGQTGGATDRRITLVWEYNTDLFDAGTAERMVGHYLNVLRGLAAGPDRPVSELPLLGEGEANQLLADWNRTSTVYPKEQGLAQLFEAQVERVPDAIALSFDGRRMTYRELNGRANQLAHHLRRLGIGPDVLTGLCLERSPELIVAILGIIKAGGAYVPLDPTYPKPRLEFMIEDTHAPVLLTEERLLAGLPAGQSRVVCLDRDWGTIRQESDRNPSPTAGAEHLAYVMYTSGSMGVPKGVCVPHRAVSRLVLNTDYVELTPRDVVAQVSNASFDAATFEIWGALLNGAKLVGIGKEVILSPPEFAGALREQGVSALFLTTALFNQMAQEAPGAFAGVKHLLFGGEAVDVRWVREVCSGGGPQRLLHVYGPTETTTFATWFEVQNVAADDMTVPIGRPLANTELYVLDRWMKPVPVGVVGELYIGGDGLARGYWRRPELTAERFVDHPFRSGARLYRTGDLVRYRVDGNVEFVGRNDDQVKLRGFRIELGEIEAILRKHPGVKECAVVMQEAEGTKHLVCYVAGLPGLTPSASDLKRHLGTKLPDYMVPGTFTFLEKLPLTVNGKVDRRALPAPTGERPEDGQYVAPRTETEKQVATIWQEVLRLPRIGVHDNFFGLGGHSLLATRVVSRLRRLFKVELPLRRLFDGPTVAEVAGELELMAQPGQPGSALGSRPSADREVGEI